MSGKDKSKYATKRNKNQIAVDRARIAQMLYTGMGASAIQRQLTRETGMELSLSQINYDIQKLREEWRESRAETYDEMVGQELQRLDVLEGMLWQALRNSLDPDEITVVDKRMQKVAEGGDDEETRAVIRSIKETVKSSKADVAIFKQIESVQKERRKLLGLYAPQMSITRQEISVKGYHTISPDDWDEPEDDKDVIEGETIKHLMPLNTYPGGNGT
jgi:hypothetical protein